MDRESIELTNENWRDLVYENCITINKNNVKFIEVSIEHTGSGRHTESYSKVLKRISDGKFFEVDYENSVKDEMGWEECNYGESEATEVFPEVIETTIYK